jgi:hypothetical protein
LNNEKNKFVGTWEGTISEWGTGNLTIVLFSDSTFSLRTFGRTLLGAFSGTWDIKDGKFVLTLDTGGQIVYSYVFSNNDTTLTITNVNGAYAPSILTKQ